MNRLDSPQSPGETQQGDLSSRESRHQPLFAPELEHELSLQFEPFWAQIILHQERPLSSDQEIVEKSLALERERQFFQKVFNTAVKVAEKDTDLVLLVFDVDDTIREDIDTDYGYLTPVRPAFNLVVRELKNVLGDRMQVGLLSDLGQGRLDRELETPTFLEAVTDVICPNALISSRNSRYVDEFITGLTDTADIQKLVSAVKGVVHPSVLEATSNGLIEAKWFSTKLVILRKMIEDKQFEGINIIYIDNLFSAKVLDPHNSRITGICVQDEMHNPIYREVA